MSRDFEKQVTRAVEPALKEIAGKIQKVLDSMAARYNGRPVDEIKPALKHELAQFSDSMPDAELTRYATAISVRNADPDASRKVAVTACGGDPLRRTLTALVSSREGAVPVPKTFRLFDGTA